MQCPNCNETLVMTERQGIEIDYCPKCRGVWLDRGELDKIIERSSDYEPSGPKPENYPAPPSQHNYPPNTGYHDPYYQHKKKKKGFLGDFFDFD